MVHRRIKRAAVCLPGAIAQLRNSSASSKIGLAVAAALAVSPARSYADAAAGANATGALQEVIVTARKRSENLQDVPMSVEAFTDRDMKNLGITRFEDYAEKVPSVSFISVGPGTQLFVIRGASDGGNPNYSPASATGFFLDDSSLSLSGVQPDLHLYDIERIEVLDGPQGTTFGAGSMSGAIRYITKKPDVTAFSAGLDFEGGKIQGGQGNWTYEGFLNAPLISGILGLRLSAFSDSHGGFIDNRLTTRVWKNGAVSDNSPWARSNYNREHVEGGRAALKAVINEGWNATLTYSYQRQHGLGAWDEDLANVGARAVERFGPEARLNEARIVDFHVDGDVAGIADLVFASTYWSLPVRQQNEYSQYMENYLDGAREGMTCLNDPVYGSGPYTSCQPPVQFYNYHTNPNRYSEEVRILSKPGGRIHWLAGFYWERTRDDNSGNTYYMPGLRTDGAAFQYYMNLYGTTMSSLPPGVWYANRDKTDYLQTTEFANISFDVTERLNIEAGVVHFSSRFSDYSPYSLLAYAPINPSYSSGGSNKVNTRAGINYKITDKAMAYADFAQGFRDGGVNGGYLDSCYANGVPPKYIPDTLNNYEIGWKTTNLGGRLVWNGAAYLMHWRDLQNQIYDANICAPASFSANVGNARIYGVESNIDLRVNDNWSLQAAANYTDSRLVSSHYPTFQSEIGERLPFAPYVSYSFNIRYEHPLADRLRGYAQFDLAHKGDMWSALTTDDTFLGLPRVLQPSYSILNLRFGLTPEGGRWLGEFYITNLTDKNAIVYVNTGNFDLRETTNEPRVFGIRLNYRFGKEANAE